MRNYVGDIRLAATPLYRLLRPGYPAAIEAYASIARSYAGWLRSLEVWGLGAGAVRGPNGCVLTVSSGAVFDPIGVYRRSLATDPFRTIRTSLRVEPELELLYRADVD